LLPDLPHLCSRIRGVVNAFALSAGSRSRLLGVLIYSG
jgi:hypothetical protein